MDTSRRRPESSAVHVHPHLTLPSSARHFSVKRQLPSHSIPKHTVRRIFHVEMNACRHTCQSIFSVRLAAYLSLELKCTGWFTGSHLGRNCCRKFCWFACAPMIEIVDLFQNNSPRSKMYWPFFFLFCPSTTLPVRKEFYPIIKEILNRLVRASLSHVLDYLFGWWAL